MVFCAVHCIAWCSEFQTSLELQLWRSFAITIIVVPVALALPLGAATLIENHVDCNLGLIISVLYMPIAIIYIAARLILSILSFTSLRRLPVRAFETIQWTTCIPHI